MFSTINMYYFCNPEKNIKNVNLDRERCTNVNLETSSYREVHLTAFLIKNSLTAFHPGLHFQNLIYLTFSRYNSQLWLPGFQNNFCGSLRISSLLYLSSWWSFPMKGVLEGTQREGGAPQTWAKGTKNKWVGQCNVLEYHPSRHQISGCDFIGNLFLLFPPWLPCGEIFNNTALGPVTGVEHTPCI